MGEFCLHAAAQTCVRVCAQPAERGALGLAELHAQAQASASSLCNPTACAAPAAVAPGCPLPGEVPPLAEGSQTWTWLGRTPESSLISLISPLWRLPPTMGGHPRICRTAEPGSVMKMGLPGWPRLWVPYLHVTWQCLWPLGLSFSSYNPRGRAGLCRARGGGRGCVGSIHTFPPAHCRARGQWAPQLSHL